MTTKKQDSKTATTKQQNVHEQYILLNNYVESIAELSDIQQAEIIAEQFTKISNEYDPIDSNIFNSYLSNFENNLRIEPHEVYKKIEKMKILVQLFVFC